MTWSYLRPTGATRDLWVTATNGRRTEYGVFHLDDGIDVHRMLAVHGPPGLTEHVWWEQVRETYGTRRRDMLHQAGHGGLKLVSTRLCEVLQDAGGGLQVFDVEVRLRSGDPIDGYVGVLEPDDVAGPVHSYERGHRSTPLVACDDVVAAVRAAGLTGLDIRPCDPDLPFPGEHVVVEPGTDWLGQPVEPSPDLPRRPLRLPPAEVEDHREH